MTCLPPKIPRAITIPHSKGVAIIIIFYIKIYYFSRYNLIKIYTKTYQNCTIFSKFSHVAYAPEPLAHMSANKL